MARGRRKVLPSRAQEHVISELIYLNLSSPSEPAQQITPRSHYEAQVSPRVVENVLRHFQNAGYVESSGGSNKLYRLRPPRLRKSRSTSDNEETRRRRPPHKEEKIERCGSRESSTSRDSRDQLRGRKRKRSREPSYEPDRNDADSMSSKVNKKCRRDSTTSTSADLSLESRELLRGCMRKRSREPSYERDRNDPEVTEERGHQRDNDAEEDAMSDDSLTSAERRWRMRHPVLMWTPDRRKPKRSRSNSSVSSAIRRWSMRRHLIHWSPTPEPMEVETPSERTHKHVTFAPDTKEGSPDRPRESSPDKVTEERGHQRDNDAEEDAMSDDSLTSAERRWRMRHPVLMWTPDRRKPKRSRSNSSVSSAIRRWSMRRHLIHWSPTPEPMEVETPSERTHKHVTFAPDTKEGSPDRPRESSPDSMR